MVLGMISEKISIASVPSAEVSVTQVLPNTTNAWVTLTSALVTLAILIFSEIIPKTIGATYWKQLSGFTAHTCRVLIILMWPLVALSKFITRLLAHGARAPSVS